VTRSPLAERFVAAANAEPRRAGRAVDMLVLHYTGMASAAAALELLVSKESGVSCHYLVETGGRIIQMVDEELRAWHAGVSSWRGERDTNSRSIGIEIHNPGHMLGYPDFPDPQMRAVIALCRDIGSRHAIPRQQVLAHSDVAPGRKIDPGEKFDWHRLHRAGLGHWVAPAAPDDRPLSPAELEEFQRLLAAYGYDVVASGQPDEQTARVTDAFQRHFRPALVTGRPDRSCLDTARRLVRPLQPLRQSARRPGRSAL
jgi:N-acetylmuramoyl-L-alanine amidase